MTVGQEARFRLAKDVHTRDFDGELVILSLGAGDYFGVNEIGSRLWSGLVAGKSVGEIADEITADYEVSRARLLDDLVAIANEFVGRGLLTIAEPTPCDLDRRCPTCSG